MVQIFDFVSDAKVFHLSEEKMDKPWACYQESYSKKLIKFLVKEEE